MENENITRKFVRVIRDWSPSRHSLDDVSRALLVDALAVCVAGSSEEGPEILTKFIRNQAMGGPCTVIGKNLRSSLVAAAQINALSMHVLDFEPMWNPPNHVLSTLIPSLLALAESSETLETPFNARKLFRSLAKGIEAQGRLRLSSGHHNPSELNFHPPGSVGPVACAIACSEFLDLTEDQFVHAVGIACSRVGGLLVNIGSMTKALHCADASRNGLESAILASMGFTSNTDALSGPQGYAKIILGKKYQPHFLVEPVSEPMILNPGPAWKLFPSQFATHFVISAALECYKSLGTKVEIHSVKIFSPEMSYIDRGSPMSGLDGKFSMQYCCAVALLDGVVNVESFEEARLFATDVQSLLRKIKLIQTPEIKAQLDSMWVKVVVNYGHNLVIEAVCDAPLGSWSNPIPLAAVYEKADVLLRHRLRKEDYLEFNSEIKKGSDSLSISKLLKSLRRLA